MNYYDMIKWRRIFNMSSTILLRGNFLSSEYLHVISCLNTELWHLTAQFAVNGYLNDSL